MSGNSIKEAEYGGEGIKDIIKELKKSSVGLLVKRRLEDFLRKREEGDESWFSELCFCILTANYKAKEGMRIQEMLGCSFHKLSDKDLERKLREMGYRFPRTRAAFIFQARRFRGNLRGRLLSLKDPHLMREWLVKNIKGLGYKEASHFLRNVGFFNLAILDRHVLRFMKDFGLIRHIPKTITKKCYLNVEKKLEELAKGVGVSLGELDLYIWYIATGEILK